MSKHLLTAAVVEEDSSGNELRDEKFSARVRQETFRRDV
jgi:hypothetical protein